MKDKRQDIGHGHDHDHTLPHAHYLSVGIDIGSSTSHLIFSRLAVGKRSPMPFARYEVLEREMCYASPIFLTPYENPATIDTGRLAGFIRKCYRDAGIRPDEVHTGAVITTGEAARKENAQRIVELFAEGAGRFVCATAGPYLEAVLAAHGSGTVSLSRESRSTLLNIDIGGGTTKLTLVREGQIVETAIINVGARLVAWNGDGVIERLEEAGAVAADQLGLELRVGSRLGDKVRLEFARALAGVLGEMIEGTPSPLMQKLLITPIPAYSRRIDGIIVSGGVSEYVYGAEDREFGDLGPLLGKEFRSVLNAKMERDAVLLMNGEAKIRATVIGTSQFTLQLSGDTIHLPDDETLPMRNIPVVPVQLEEEINSETVCSQILQALRKHDISSEKDAFALAFRLPHFRGYGIVESLAQGICKAVEGPGSAPHAVLVFEQNIGRVVGERLRELVGARRFACVDEIKVQELDYIDVGQKTAGQEFVPVVVKSLVFQAARLSGS